jgi:hypothetical protein
MKYVLIIGALILACVFALALILGIWGISLSNKEQSLRNLVVAKQVDNTNEFDKMKKTLTQICQLTDAQTQMLVDVIVGNADARSKAMVGGGAIFSMKTVQEAIPNVDTSIITKIYNQVVASREAWSMRQKELIDLNRAHTDVVTLFPGSIVCMILGRKEIEIIVVTSSETKEAFRTGVDDNTDLGLPKRNTKSIEKK